MVSAAMRKIVTREDMPESFMFPHSTWLARELTAHQTLPGPKPSV